MNIYSYNMDEKNFKILIKNGRRKFMDLLIKNF